VRLVPPADMSAVSRCWRPRLACRELSALVVRRAGVCCRPGEAEAAVLARGTGARNQSTEGHDGVRAGVGVGLGQPGAGYGHDIADPAAFVLDPELLVLPYVTPALTQGAGSPASVPAGQRGWSMRTSGTGRSAVDLPRSS
jgi:hypothetical protein